MLISSLGCSPFFRKVDFTENKTVFLAVQLQNCTQQLREVVVEDSPDFIQENGDTLSFEVAGFTAKTDLTLGDILRRMPGIEISADNQILYQNKRVRQIWVEGRDILNNQHSLAIESLRATDIERIQIVREYKPFYQRFSQGHSSDVAMNIDLKEKAEGRVNGQAEALVGTNSRHHLRGEVFKVEEKSGLSTFLRSNTIGAKVIEPLEYMSLFPDFRTSSDGKSGKVEVIPKTLLPATNAFEQQQHFFSVSADTDINGKSNLKGSVLGLLKNTKEAATIQTFFFDDNSVFTGQGSRQLRFPMLFGTIVNEYEASENTLFSLNLSVRFSEETTKDRRAGLFRAIPYHSVFSGVERTRDIRPSASISFRHAPGWSSNHQAGAAIQKEALDYRFLENNNKLTYGQQLDQYFSNVFLSSVLENRNTIFLLKIKNHLELGRQETNLTFDQLTGFDNRPNYTYRWGKWQAGTQYGVKTDHWMVNLQLEMVHHQLNISEQTFQRSWLNPVFRFKYSWNQLMFIGFSLLQSKAFIDPQQTFDVYRLYDNLQLKHSMLMAGQHTRTRQLDFYFFSFQKQKKKTLNCTFNFAEKNNTISFFNNFENDFIIRESFLAPKSEQSTFLISYTRPIARKKYTIRTNLSGNQTFTERARFSAIHKRNLQLSALLLSEWKGSWNIQLGSSYQLSEQQQGQSELEWNVWSAGAGVQYKHKKWEGRFDYDRRYSRIGGKAVTLHLLDVNISYDLNNWLALTVSGQDVCNLGRSQNLRLLTAPSFTEEAIYQRLQGSVLMGVKGRF